MPNVFDFELVSVCRWVGGCVQEKAKTNYLHLSGFVRQRMGNSVVLSAYPVDYKPSLKRD